MTFLLVVNVVLLVAGAFMEPSAIILILAPILFPIATRLGIDPVHLGIIMVINLEIGLITPGWAQPVRHLCRDRHATGGHRACSNALVADPAVVPDPVDLRALDRAGVA